MCASKAESDNIFISKLRNGKCKVTCGKRSLVFDTRVQIGFSSVPELIASLYCACAKVSRCKNAFEKTLFEEAMPHCEELLRCMLKITESYPDKIDFKSNKNLILNYKSKTSWKANNHNNPDRVPMGALASALVVRMLYVQDNVSSYKITDMNFASYLEELSELIIPSENHLDSRIINILNRSKRAAYEEKEVKGIGHRTLHKSKPEASAPITEEDELRKSIDLSVPKQTTIVNDEVYVPVEVDGVTRLVRIKHLS